MLYKTANIINNKIYIGIHQTKNLNDGYLGSGTSLKQDIRKYGKDNFKKDILMLFDSYEEMCLNENLIVDQAFVSRTDTYNMTTGGQVPPNHRKGKKNWNSGIKTGAQSIEHIRKRTAHRKGKPSPLRGRKHSEQSKANMSAGSKGKNKGKIPWNKGLSLKITS